MIRFSVKIAESVSGAKRNVSSEISLIRKDGSMLDRSLKAFVNEWTDWFFNDAIKFIQQEPKDTEVHGGAFRDKIIKDNLRKERLNKKGTAQSFKDMYITLAKYEMASRNQYVTGKTIKELKKQSKFIRVNVNKDKRTAEIVIKKSNRWEKYNDSLNIRERVQTPFQFLAIVNWFIEKGLLKNAKNPRALAIFLARRITGYYSRKKNGVPSQWSIDKRLKNEGVKQYRRTNNRQIYKNGAKFGETGAFVGFNAKSTYEVVSEEALTQLKGILFSMAEKRILSEKRLFVNKTFK